MEHFFLRIQVKTKKMSSPKMERFFPKLKGETCAQVQTRAKFIGRDADVDHTLIIGGGCSQIIGGYILPGFGTSVSGTKSHSK